MSDTRDGSDAPTLGHVHLEVRDLDRSVAFYGRVLNLEVTERLGDAFAFLSGDDRHHELALQALGDDAEPPSPNAVGLYHTAWEVPDGLALARAHERLVAEGAAVDAVDHGISWALYARDPDGHGLEIYLDRRSADEGASEWRGRSRRLDPDRIAGSEAIG